jgi:hypothetical protein
MDFYSLIPAEDSKFFTPIINNEINSKNIPNLLKESKYLNQALVNMASNHSIVKI